MKNRIILAVMIIMLTACSHLSNVSADIEKCRVLAYKNDNEQLDKGMSADAIFNKCQLDMKKTRGESNHKANTLSFLEFLFNLSDKNK